MGSCRLSNLVSAICVRFGAGGRLRLKGTERILDLGCGDGKVTAELAARVPHGSTLGIDTSAT